jgi:hypothetical protein
MPRAAHLLAALAAAATLVACKSAEPVREGACSVPTLAETPFHRMSRFEYDNTVRDLLGDDSNPALALPPDEASTGFDNQSSSLGVTELSAEQYLEVAEQVAGRAVKNLPALLGCDPKAIGESACAQSFIKDFGKRAFRRPLDGTQRKRLVDLFTWGRGKYGFTAGIKLVLTAMLQSPRFLYRVELGMPDPGAPGVTALDGWEIASRLSYLLWASTPDQELLDAAENDRLGTPAEIAAQAARMLEDPRARGSVGRFHEQWLGVSLIDGITKDTSVYPEYHDSLKELWRQETVRFLEQVVFEDHGGIHEMLTAPWTMMNGDLAAFYGIEGGPTGSDWVRVDLDPTQRAGFMTQASILAMQAKPNQTSPVHRGKFVRERVLCEVLPAPPPNMTVAPPPVDPHATTRQKFMQHSADPYCASCHQYMDGVGLGFEHYDGIGLWRDTDHDLPVDARGAVVGSSDSDGPFDGVIQLAGRLARSEEVRDCLVTEWFRYAYGRDHTDADACTVAQLQATLSGSGGRVEDLLIALTQTDAFRYKKSAAPQ